MDRENLNTYEQSDVAMTCRSFQEYADMFQLSTESLASGPVLDVASGASSFTAEASQMGIKAFAADPLYSMEPGAIYRQGKLEIQAATSKLSDLSHVYDWDYYGSLSEHEKIREHSLEVFIRDYAEDFAASSRDRRYFAGKLPSLPFEDGAFSLVLCSHFLFLYEEQFGLDFHLEALRELIRVCRRGGEIRIYPTVTLQRRTYPHLDYIMDFIESTRAGAGFVPTPFRFLKGAAHVFRISK